MKKVFLVIGIIIILAVVMFFVYPKNHNATEKSNNVLQPNTDSKQNKNQVDNRNKESRIDEPRDTNKRQQGDPIASSSSVGSGGQGTAMQTENCERQQISYSLTNFGQNQICNVLIGNVCTDKTATCSVDVKNLDDETTGNFVINFNYASANNPDYTIQTDKIQRAIAPNQLIRFESNIDIQSQGESGDANREISCTAASETIPTKEVCS